MKLLPIEQDENQNAHLRANSECCEVLDVYPEFYARVGFHPPWIGYFFARDEVVVGCGGFKGKPNDGKVEIAYGTFTDYQGQGIGTEICRRLVALSLQTDPLVRIMARTLPEHYASIGILKKNGFEFVGMAWEEGDGDVAEFEYKGGQNARIA